MTDRDLAIGTVQVSGISAADDRVTHAEVNGCGFTLCGIWLFRSDYSPGFSRGGGSSDRTSPCPDCVATARRRYEGVAVRGLGGESFNAEAESESGDRAAEALREIASHGCTGIGSPPSCACRSCIARRALDEIQAAGVPT